MNCFTLHQKFAVHSSQLETSLHVQFLFPNSYFLIPATQEGVV